jgi:hypothetical protein
MVIARKVVSGRLARAFHGRPGNLPWVSGANAVH